MRARGRINWALRVTMCRFRQLCLIFYGAPLQQVHVRITGTLLSQSSKLIGLPADAGLLELFNTYRTVISSSWNIMETSADLLLFF